MRSVILQDVNEININGSKCMAEPCRQVVANKTKRVAIRISRRRKMITSTESRESGVNNCKITDQLSTWDFALMAPFDLDACIAQLLRKQLLHEALLREICEKTKEVLMRESNVVHVSAPVTVVGDIHG
jgi:hypothetical protein